MNRIKKRMWVNQIQTGRPGYGSVRKFGLEVLETLAETPESKAGLYEALIPLACRKTCKIPCGLPALYGNADIRRINFRRGYFIGSPGIEHRVAGRYPFIVLPILNSHL